MLGASMNTLISEASAREAMAATLTAQLQALRSELLADNEKPKRGQVHRLRVASRRLLATLSLARAAGVEVQAGLVRRCERLLDDLSPLRDAQVMALRLSQLPDDELDGRLLARVRSRQRRERERVGKRLRRFDVEKLTRQVSMLSERVAAGGRARGDLEELALTGFLARQQLAIDEQRARARQASPRELHRLRLALKGYRYTLEILAGQLPHAAHGLIQVISELQDELGRAHDVHVLCELVTRDAEARGSERSRHLAKQLAAESDRAHAHAAEQVSRATLAWPLPSPKLAEALSHTRSVP